MAYTLTWDHGVTADDVSEFEISQSEGDFAALTVTVKNPRVGLLSGILWATLADGTGTLFYGRLIGVPDALQADSVQLVFLARPDTYDADKAALAETLKVDPFWDPVFIPPDQRENPDAVLEARPALWHTDRVTHAVTLSDILEGEAGVVVIDPDLVVYDSVHITPGETPAEEITCKAEVRWRQKAGGSIDLTPLLYEKFAEAGSIEDGLVTSYTGDGLVSDWPDAGTTIGAGWTVGRSSAIRDENRTTVLGVNLATGGFSQNAGVDPVTGELVEEEITVWKFQVVDSEGNPIAPGSTTYWCTDSEGRLVTQRDPPGQQYTSTYYTPPETPVGWSPVHPNPYNGDPEDRGGPSVAGFAKWFMAIQMRARFDVDRERVETLDFTITADVQPLISARQDTNIAIEMQSAEVDQPIDPGGALPIVTPRRRSYFLTDRGHRSVEYLIALCRARLLARARAVEVSFTTTFAVGRALSLRHSVSLSDPRLPGGIATGKIVGLTLAFADGKVTADVTMACTIGRGATLAAPDVGADTYADDYATNYTVVVGGATEIAGDVQYEDYGDTPIIDDGLNLYAMDAADAVEDLVITGGASAQATILAGGFVDSNAAVEALRANPTHVALTMKPLNGEPYVTPFDLTVSELMVPKTIDLEA